MKGWNSIIISLGEWFHFCILGIFHMDLYCHIMGFFGLFYVVKVVHIRKFDYWNFSIGCWARSVTGNFLKK